MKQINILFKKSSFLILFLLLNFSSVLLAQKKRPDRSIAHLYEMDFRAIEDKIEREHIPLDGDSVRFIPFRKDALYGFVDKQTKEWVIQPTFTQVFAVYKEGAIVKVENEKDHIDGYGLVGYDGKFLIQPYFSNLFKEGNLYHGMYTSIDTAMVEGASMFVNNIYLDLNGKFLFEAPAHKFGTFEEGDSLAWFRYGPDYSVFNRSGKRVKQFKYDSTRHFLGIFNNVLVTGYEKGEHRFYEGKDVNGHPKFHITNDESYARAVFKMSDTVYALLSEDAFSLSDANGNDYPYGIANDWYGNGFGNWFSFFNQLELIPVTDYDKKKMGAISKDGRLVIPCEYDYLGYFVNGLAPFQKDHQDIGFINAKNEVVVPPVIDSRNAYESSLRSQGLYFSDGLCRVLVEMPDSIVNGVAYTHQEEGGLTPFRTAYINMKGEQQLLLPDTIILAGDFSGGLAVVSTKSGATGFIDTTDKIVIPLKYELAAAGAYPFPQIVYPIFKNGYAYIKSYKGYIDSKGKEYFSGKRMKDEYDFSH